MRDIKFRGKYKDEWVYGSLISDELLKQKYIVVVNPKTRPYKLRQLPIVKDTIGQFTGLYDCDGSEIFEGDIIRTLEPVGLDCVGYNNLPRYDIVSFCTDADGLAYYGSELQSYIDNPVRGKPNLIPVKVIGNKTDNPVWVTKVQKGDAKWLVINADPDLKLSTLKRGPLVVPT